MKAAIFEPGKRSAAFHLRIEDVPRPQVAPGYVLLRVLACGVCRTDLHIVEGDLPVLTVIRKRIFPVIGRQGLCGLA